jgi:hypothetical protein
MAGPLQTTMFNGVSDFYNGVATQSLRFAYTSAETWLARTPDAGNRKTHTLSVWVKRSGISASQNILEARGSGDSESQPKDLEMLTLGIILYSDLIQLKAQLTIDY